MQTRELSHRICECGTCVNCASNIRYCLDCEGADMGNGVSSLTTHCRKVRIDSTALEQVRDGYWDWTFDGGWKRLVWDQPHNV